MLVSLRKNGLDSLFKEVRVFKVPLLSNGQRAISLVLNMLHADI